MKKNLLKIVIMCVAVLIIAIIVLILEIKNKSPEISDINNDNNAIVENQILVEIMPESPKNNPNEIYGKTMQVDNYAEYLDVKECIDNFNKNLIILYSNEHPIAMYEGEENTYNTNDKTLEKIYNLLDKQYLTYYNVSKNNIARVIDYGVYKFNIDGVYKKIEKDNSNITNYIAFGKLIDSLNNGVRDYAYIVRVDSKNKVYSIVPYNYIIANGINERNFNIQNNEITENENNTLNLNNFDKGKYALALFENYKTNLIYNKEKAFNQLDSDYCKNRFQNAADFYTYIANSENEIRISSLGQYNVAYKDGYTECILYDKNNTYYCIRAKTPTDYTVMLDPYTVDDEEYIEEYNEANEERKVNIIVEKIKNMINANNDYYLYNRLNATFKANKCPSQEYFSQAVRKNMYNKNDFTIIESKKQGDAYIVEIEVQNSEKKADDLKYITFIIKPQTNADFEFSFNIE